MKKFLNGYLSMMLIASLFLVTSCGEEGDPLPDLEGPTLLLGGEDMDATAFDVGETVDLEFEFTAPEQISSFNVITEVDGTPVDTTYINPTTIGLTGNETEGTIVYSYPLPAQVNDVSLAGKDVTLVFEVVDKQNEVATIDYEFAVNEAEVAVFPAVLLYAPAADGTTETFFSVNDGATYSSDEVTGTAEAISPLIDFGYFYGQNFGPTLASIADFPTENAGTKDWNVKNDTNLRMTDLTESAFTESTATTINEAFEEAEPGENEGQVRNLEVGDVIAFETDADKEGGSVRGLIYVQDIEPGTATTNFIEVLVKVIEE